jgi:hypothetical protein
MSAPQVAAMAPNCTLDNGCTVEFVAINAATGAAVSGVLISAASIYVDTTALGAALDSGPFMLVPGPSA